ncbi:MAG: hypothetical protein U1F41_00880 [Burkholderiales bacterium]
MKTNYLEQPHSTMSWPLAASGAWTIGAYIGANLFAIGLLLTLRAEASFVQGITLAAAGAVIAVLAWRKAYRLMAALESGAQEGAAPERLATAMPSLTMAASA